jgi:hypothetical protein
MKSNLWLRFFFLLVVIQAFTIGRALIWPDLIGQNLPWPASPLNARFAAALYWMGAISALLSMVARRYVEVRISLIEIGVITGGLLLLTLPHLGEFTPETFPYRWLILYTIDPLLVGLVVWWMGKRESVKAARNPLARLLLGYAAALALIGSILLLAPELAAQLWPWALPPILSQVYSIFFLTFALGGWLAAREPDWEGVWIYVTANLLMLVLIVAVSVIHADRFKAGPQTVIWYGLCLAGIVALIGALIRGPRRLAASGVTS